MSTGRFILIVLAVVGTVWSEASAQDGALTLTQCQEMATGHYPVARQKEYYEHIARNNIEALNMSWFPQLTVQGQATYQSEVTELSLPSSPGMESIEIKPDNYNIGIEVRQSLYDFGRVSTQKLIEDKTAQVQIAQVDVELQKLHERINTLYGNILLQIENKNILHNRRTDLETSRKEMESAVRNGASVRSNLLIIESEILGTDQKLDEANANLQSLVTSLGLLIGRSLDTTTVFVLPETAPTLATEISRPELHLFESQKKLLEARDDLLTKKSLPALYAFGQGNYGRPGFNFLNMDFRLYGIAGVGLSWDVAGLYSHGQEQNVLHLNEQIIDTQRELFDLNLQTALLQQSEEITKYQKLVSKDRDIVEAKKEIREISSSQLNNGAITASEYVNRLDAENTASFQLKMHEIQLAMAKIAYLTLTGNKP